MAGIIEQGIYTLVQNGLVELLVFALIFAIVFGVLQKIQIFGTEDKDNTKKYNAMIALAMAVLVILPHYVSPGASYDIIPILEKALPQTMLVLIVILSILILLGLLGLHGIHDEEKNKTWRNVIAIVLVIIVIWLFVGATGTFFNLPYWLSSDLIAVIVALAIFGLIVNWVMSGE